MEDQLKLAFQFAADLSNHLVTLSTAVLGLSVTFSKEVVSRSFRKSVAWLLVVSWSLYLFSIACGVLSLMALTGSLAPVETGDAVALTGIGSNARGLAKYQIISFFLASVLQVLFGACVLRDIRFVGLGNEGKLR